MLFQNKMSVHVPVLLGLAMGANFCSGIAQAQEGQGWIEGTVLNASGKAPGDVTAPGYIGVKVKLAAPAKGDTATDIPTNGYYAFRDLKPGVYDIFIEKSRLGDEHYRPQHIFGVLVKPGVRTKLNIVVNEGEAIEEIGHPVVATQPAILISRELERLQHEIDDLKKK